MNAVAEGGSARPDTGKVARNLSLARRGSTRSGRSTFHEPDIAAEIASARKSDEPEMRVTMCGRRAIDGEG